MNTTVVHITQVGNLGAGRSLARIPRGADSSLFGGWGVRI